MIELQVSSQATSEPEPASQKVQSSQPPKSSKNPMREIHIEKVTINIGVGEGGEKLSKAEKVLELLTKRKPIKTISKTTNKDWGIKEKMPIGCKVTLRGEIAKKFLKDAFWIKENKIPSYSFDPYGNFSFGIQDYTDLPGMKYDPNIGIFGMDVSVVLQRPGYRVMKRKRNRGKIPKKHKIKPKEGLNYLKNLFNLEIVD